MASFAATTIPLSSIEKIQIYENNGVKTISQIKSATGCDYIINGTLYNMSNYKINCHCKINGIVKCKPDYSARGFAWNTGSDIVMGILPNVTQKNYITCTPLIYDGHVKIPKLIYNVDQGGKRGRTAIGIKGNSLALYCTKDGTSYARTPEQLQTDLYNAGWDYAIMLDGGGSSQCIFPDATVASSINRKVGHLILVYLKKTTSSGGTTSGGTTTNPYNEPNVNVSYGQSGNNVRWVQWQLNHVFGYSNVTVDGIFGNATLTAVKAVQSANNLTVDGIVGVNTRAVLKSSSSSSSSGNTTSTTTCPYAEPTVNVSYGQSGNNVRWVQWMLHYNHGYTNVAVDGIFGNATKTAVMGVQEKAKIAVDGIVGVNTRKALKN